MSLPLGENKCRYSQELLFLTLTFQERNLSLDQAYGQGRRPP